jgi:hypothetical protein
MQVDSIEAFDADLRKHLGAIDDAALREAWHAATDRTEPLVAIRRAVDAFDERARALGLDVIARVDRRRGAVLALRFMGLPEIEHPNELYRDPERIPRRQRAVGILYASTSELTAEELARAVALGRLVLDGAGLYDRSKLRMLWEHPDLQTPARRFAALGAALAAQREAPQGSWAGTLLTWLSLRLVEDPYPDAAATLIEALEQGTLPHAADMLGALGDPAILERIAARVDTDREDGGAVACVFALDPARAFDRLGARLSPTEPRPRLTRLLEVLAQDGFRTEALDGEPSSRPRGWVRADPRWIDGLLALRGNDNPNVSMRAASALGSADLDLVLSKLPRPKKKIPPLEIELLGTVALAPSMFRRAPVWLGAGRVVVADSASTLALHGLSAGMPRVATFALPEHVTLPTARAAANDDPWEVPGLYDVAIRSDGGLAVGAQASDYSHLLALYDPAGKRLAAVRMPEEGAVFPHALHFGAAGAGCLWVALVDEGGHVAAAFDAGTLARLGETSLGPSFPPPAWFEVFPHPVEDVGVFAIQCGQDGAWLKVVERGPKLALRKQKLDTKQGTVELVGFSADGALAAFASGQTLGLRAWPALDAPKKKRLDGSVVGAGIVGDAIGLAIAEVTRAPSAIELRRFPDGERIAKARHPSEDFVAIGHGVLVTQKDEATLSVWRLGAPR